MTSQVNCSSCPQSSAFGCNGKEYCECICHLCGDIDPEADFIENGGIFAGDESND